MVTASKRRAKSGLKRPKAASRAAALNEDIPSESDDELLGGDGDRAGGGASSDSEAGETAAAKRYRLAKDYIGAIERKQAEGRALGADEEADGDDAVGAKLRDDALSAAGRQHRSIAERARVTSVRRLGGHRHAPTCVAVSADGAGVYCGAKDGTVAKFDAASGKLVAKVAGCSAKSKKAPAAGGRRQRHAGAVYAIALAGEHLCTGGADKDVVLWSRDDLRMVRRFSGHRKAILAMAAQCRGGAQLYTASADHCVKVWDALQMAYVDTMFGHGDRPVALSVLARDRPVSVGSRDRTARMWKVADEAQLVFLANEEYGSLDCVAMFSDDRFATGAADGSIHLWSSSRKKPLSTARQAHGPAGAGVSALAAVPYSDMVASGDRLGNVRLWRVAPDAKGLLPVGTVKVCGMVNGLAFSADGRLLAAAVAKEPRLGRWHVAKEGKNSVVIIDIDYQPVRDVVVQ